MTELREIDQKLSVEYVNSVKDELRKIKQMELAKQILGEAGVELGHVADGKGTYTLWGSGVDRAILQGVLKRVLERARQAVGDDAMDGGSPSATTCLAKLITQYNHTVIVAAAGSGEELGRQLTELDQQDEPKKLRQVAIKIRCVASEMRQRLDDEEQFKILPLQPGEYSGPSPDQRRERLTWNCYKVIVAADQVSRLCRLLSDDDDDEGAEDESWGLVAVDPMLQMMREQYAHRELGESKLRLAAHVRRLLRDLRAIPLESSTDI